MTDSTARYAFARKRPARRPSARARCSREARPGSWKLRGVLAAAALLAYATTGSAEGTLVFLTKWGSTGSALGQFNEPVGIAVGPDGNVYVADRGNHRIQVFSNTGAFVTAWGDSGTGNGQFNSPRDVTVAANGEVYVTDFFNNRIQVFSAGGTYLRQWGTFGTADGQFKSPRGVCVDESLHVFVSEDGLPNKRIQKFTSVGVFLGKWGTLGTATGEFQSPRDVAVDANSHVYVSDALANRVQKFTSTGGFLVAWGSTGSGDGQFQFTGGVDDDGARVLVMDTNNHRLQIFGAGGAFMDATGSQCRLADGAGCVDPDGTGGLALGDGQFYFPLGVAVEADGDVFVADSQNHRIQKFTRAPTSSTGPAFGTLSALSVYPNPMRTMTSVRLGLAGSDLASGGQSRLVARVYDSAGRLVRELFTGSLPAGNHTLGWDCRSFDGRLVPPGVYFVDVQVNDALSRSVKVVRLR